MMNVRSVAFATMFVFAVFPSRAQDLKASIDASNAEFNAAFSKGDTAAIAAHYTEDAQLLPPGEKIVKGKAAIQAYWKALIDQGLTDLTLSAVEVGSDGDQAYEVGQFSIHVPAQEGQDAVETGKYLVVYKKVDGKWLLHRDMWNADQPAQ